MRWQIIPNRGYVVGHWRSYAHGSLLEVIQIADAPYSHHPYEANLWIDHHFKDRRTFWTRERADEFVEQALWDLSAFPKYAQWMQEIEAQKMEQLL